MFSDGLWSDGRAGEVAKGGISQRNGAIIMALLEDLMTGHFLWGWEGRMGFW